ncbi:hypothetical protein KPH14_011689 [Odynerus spinipes]|uniref:Gustatory receptor n=1 Tax=Odynerus spinipes TaxID=1348599 RepID=A0AAD9RVD3_9HYME|nr:hypothetical protein KPH14_011689 [Odynerus spinipes]
MASRNSREQCVQVGRQSVRTELLLSTVTALTLYFNMFTTAASMLFCLWNSTNLSLCLKKMSVVDDTLLGLGFEKEYKKIYTSMIFVVIGWVATVLLMNTIGFLWNNAELTIRRLFIYFIANHFVHVNTVLDLVFIILLSYGRTRFRKLNEYIIQRCKSRHCLKKAMRTNNVASSTDRSIVEKSTFPLEEYDIWISMHIHLELSRICNNLNKIFGAQMILEMTSFFIFITGLVCELYTTLTTYKIWDSWKIKNVLDIILWSTFYVIKLLCINYTCEAVSLEANRTQELIQKVMDSLHLMIREEVLQFISEMTYKRLKFSAFGLYDYGYTFIRQFFGGITTILIMLLQVEASPVYTNNTTVSPI